MNAMKIFLGLAAFSPKNAYLVVLAVLLQRCEGWQMLSNKSEQYTYPAAQLHVFTEATAEVSFCSPLGGT
jgi:hypothetical protein